ncbi:hypothetical protein [Pseudomonas sp. HY2-MNA-CIBAN-0224]|uniref:hypothetical protein n=1 Tax=Pseudomonas sp. HY2-MNA-CIBAN-0224 TaxID=3140471 RepID=UPI0033242F3E
MSKHQTLTSRCGGAMGGPRRFHPAPRSDWAFDTAPILLLIPPRKNRSRKVQALASFLNESFKSKGPEKSRA